MHAALTLLLALSTPFAAGDPATHPDDAVARVYDLSGLFVPGDGNERTQRVFPVLAREPYDVSREGRADDWELPRTLVRLLLAGDFESEGVVVEELAGARLAVRAAPAVHQRLQNALAEIDKSLAGTLELELCVLRLEGASDLRAGTVPDAQAQGWIDAARGAGRLERLALRLGRGTTAGVEVGRQVEYVGDFDVEVAEGSLTFDPQMNAAWLGTCVSARASAARDGHFVALALRRVSALGAPERREVERSTSMLAGDAYRVGHRSLAQESLPVLGRSLALNAFLPRGSALVAVLSHDAARVSEALIVRVVGGGLPPSRIVPAGPGGHGLALLDVTRWSPPVAYGDVLDVLGESSAILPSPHRAEWNVSVATAPWDRDEGGGDALDVALRMAGGEPVASEGWWPLRAVDLGADAARIVERIEAFAPEGSNVDVELALRRGDRVLARLALPLLAGRRSDAVLCSEDLLVSEADVEIAKYSAVEDPVQREQLEGLLVSLRPLRTPSGAIVLELGGMGVASAGPRRTIELADEGNGELETEDQDYLRLDELLRFDTGRGATTVRIGDGALGLALDVTL